MVSYGITGLCQLWFRYWLGAIRHHAITCQLWFRYWLGAIRHHAITWTNAIFISLCVRLVCQGCPGSSRTILEGPIEFWMVLRQGTRPWTMNFHDLCCDISVWGEILVKKYVPSDTSLNSLRPSDAYMRQCNMPTFVQIMACCLLSTKPLSEPMLPYC